MSRLAPLACAPALYNRGPSALNSEKKKRLAARLIPPCGSHDALAEESTTSATGAFVMDSDFVLVRGVEEPTDQSVN